MTERGDLVAELGRRHAVVVGELEEAARASGRGSDSFRVVAVTKGVPLEVVSAAAAAGLATFGESRVQEALPKVAALPDVEWHFIGRLQANKVRSVVRAFALIHSVESLHQLQRIERIAVEEQRRPRVLLQVHVGAEPRKGGFAVETLQSAGGVSALQSALGGLQATTVAGLMTIAPMVERASDARHWFRRLRELRESVQERLGLALPELSMGMSGDAEAAIAEGATLVRIGTRIFWGLSERDLH